MHRLEADGLASACQREFSVLEEEGSSFAASPRWHRAKKEKKKNLFKNNVLKGPAVFFFQSWSVMSTLPNRLEDFWEGNIPARAEFRIQTDNQIICEVDYLGLQ